MSTLVRVCSGLAFWIVIVFVASSLGVMNGRLLHTILAAVVVVGCAVFFAMRGGKKTLGSRLQGLPSEAWLFGLS